MELQVSYHYVLEWTDRLNKVALQQTVNSLYGPEALSLYERRETSTSQPDGLKAVRTTSRETTQDF
jgi:hypothetical protein